MIAFNINKNCKHPRRLDEDVTQALLAVRLVRARFGKLCFYRRCNQPYGLAGLTSG
jgi:hypothetical protein